MISSGFLFSSFGQQKASRYHRHLLAGLLYGLFCVIVFWPLFRHPATMISDDYDGLFITWTINWVQHAILHFPKVNLYDAPILAPLSSTYTFSDPFLTAAVVSLPLRFLSPDPLVSLNVNVLLSLVLTAFAVYLCLDKLERNFLISFAGGLWASFAVNHIHYLGHLHVLMIYFIPFGIFFWLKFLETADKKFVLFFWSCFLLQVLNSPFSGYLFACCVVPLFLTTRSLNALRKNGTFFCVIGLVALFCTGVFYWLFLAAGRSYHSFRSIRDAAHFSLSINEVFDPNRVSHLYWLIWPLAISAVFFVVKKFQQKSFAAELQQNFLLAGLAALVFALGPAAKWFGETIKIPFPVPLPYAAAYYILPGFQAFRTPSRWLLAAHLCLTFWIFLSPFCKKYFSAVIGTLLVVILLIEAKPFQKFTEVPARAEQPLVYIALAKEPSGIVMHVPPYTYDMPSAKQETYRMFLSLIDQHFDHPSYNGYSGYAPQQRMDEMNLINKNVFSPQTQKILQHNQVRYLVFHLHELDGEDQKLALELKKQALYPDVNEFLIETTNFQLFCRE